MTALSGLEQNDTGSAHQHLLRSTHSNTACLDMATAKLFLQSPTSNSR